MTYVDQLERVADEVSDWATAVIFRVYETLAPDNRGWDETIQSEEDQINDYVMLRGNPEAWGQYLFELAEDISTKLMDAGLPSDDIASVHPWDLAQKFALDYSVRMETLLEGKMSHASSRI